MERNIFEMASRQQVRFPSNKGELTTEQLWTLPLTSKSGFDLDSVAKAVNSALRATTEDSFVATSTNPAKAEHELKLDIVKHIIAVRMQENADALAASGRAEQRRKLIEILGKKQDAALESLSPAEIEAKLAELGA